VSSQRLSRFAFAAPLLSATLFFVAQAPGCTTTCSDPESDDPEEFHGGVTDATRSVYESAPWDGKYLKFRTNKSYVIFHGLRGVPSVVQAWVGFDEAPLRRVPGNASEAAGNEAIIEGVTDEFVQIRNDTCETFYLRVVASDPIEDTAVGGSAGAETDDNDTASGAGSGGARN
jgi:hypothetical protein